MHQLEEPQEPNPPKIIEKSEESVVYVGLFTGCWGHEITDHLKHLWFYFAPHYAHLKNFKFAYTLLNAHLPPNPNFFEFAELLNIPRTQFVQITHATQFARVFLPDECFFHVKIPEKPLAVEKDIFYTPEYAAMIKRLPQTNAPQNAPKKLYFSRLVFNSLKDFNEKELEIFFKNQGFTIIYPEKLSFLEELTLLQHCEIFAATEGSIAHNVIFCNENATALILRKCRYHFTPHQITLNSFFKGNVFYVDCGFSPFAQKKWMWWTGPFFLYESNYLRKYFKLKPKNFPYFKFLNYWAKNTEQNFKKHAQTAYHAFNNLTHPIRAKLQIGTRLRHFFKK